MINPLGGLTTIFTIVLLLFATFIFYGIDNGTEWLMYAFGWIIAGHGFQLGVLGYKINATIIIAVMLAMLLMKYLWTFIHTLTPYKPPITFLLVSVPLIAILMIPFMNGVGWFLMRPFVDSHGDGPWVFNQLENLWESEGFYAWTSIGGNPLKVILEPGMAFMAVMLLGYAAYKYKLMVQSAKTWEQPVK